MTTINWHDVQELAERLKMQHEKWHLAHSNFDYRTDPEAVNENLEHRAEIRDNLMEKIGLENLKNKENSQKLNGFLKDIFKIEQTGKKIDSLHNGDLDPLIIEGMKKDYVPAIVTGLNDPVLGKSLDYEEILKNLRQNLDTNFWIEKAKPETVEGPDGKLYECIRFKRKSAGQLEYGKNVFQMIDVYKPPKHSEGSEFGVQLTPVIDVTTVYDDMRQSLYRLSNGEFLQDTTKFELIPETNHRH